MQSAGDGVESRCQVDLAGGLYVSRVVLGGSGPGGTRPAWDQSAKREGAGCLEAELWLQSYMPTYVYQVSGMCQAVWSSLHTCLYEV